MLDVNVRIAFTSSFSDIGSSHQVAAKTYDPKHRWINDPSFRASIAYSRKEGVGIPKDDDQHETCERDDPQYN